jgi:hypothetical protein
LVDGGSHEPRFNFGWPWGFLLPMNPKRLPFDLPAIPRRVTFDECLAESIERVRSDTWEESPEVPMELTEDGANDLDFVAEGLMEDYNLTREQATSVALNCAIRASYYRAFVEVEKLPVAAPEDDNEG